ncbi:MAG: serine O-acetyltransferase [Rhodospirillaceae bacterium]|jgi:serine O-acetyltransferase|nr:serine O-acetyltransferase [Rhodospirillaceae bacterium]
MLFKELREDIAAYMERDPAAKGPAEIILCYPGFHALLFHKMSRWLWTHNFHLAGRFLSHVAKVLTGVEIHPGAEIGRRFVIDHGTGVVIGETAVIGDDVTLYHDVTLGGVAPSVDSAAQVGQKRHPTLEDGVIVGSGAQILGPINVGGHARVGANSVVTKDVPSSVTAVGVPAKAVMPRDREKAREFQAYGTPSDGCPDPVLQTIEALRQQVTALGMRVEELEAEVEQTDRQPKSNAPRKKVG